MSANDNATTPEGQLEADMLLQAWLVAREAQRAPDPAAFLGALELMLRQVMRTPTGPLALQQRLRLAETLLRTGRTDPLP